LHDNDVRQIDFAWERMLPGFAPVPRNYVVNWLRVVRKDELYKCLTQLVYDLADGAAHIDQNTPDEHILRLVSGRVSKCRKARDPFYKTRAERNAANGLPDDVRVLRVPETGLEPARP
jgi:hypothetical protein